MVKTTKGLEARLNLVDLAGSVGFSSRRENDEGDGSLFTLVAVVESLSSGQKFIQWNQDGDPKPPLIGPSQVAEELKWKSGLRQGLLSEKMSTMAE